MRRPWWFSLTFVLIILGANWLTATWGLVTWLGITATAGTWLAGLALVARDQIQETGGRWWVLAAIGVGALLTAAISPRLALASGVAFLLSELADWAVYTPLRNRGRVGAAVASNVVGAVVDTVVFLLLAGFPLSATGSQVVVKAGMGLVAVALLEGIRALLREPERERLTDPVRHGGRGAGVH